MKPLNFKQQKKRKDANAAYNNLRKLPTQAIVATIDTMIGILLERGVVIRDWDDKRKHVRRMKMVGTGVFILAPHEKPEAEVTTHGAGQDGQ